MKREEIVDLMRAILERQGKDATRLREDAALREVAFRSLDFSELCLRVEQAVGRELNFEAAALRNVSTVKDVCDFLEQAGA